MQKDWKDMTADERRVAKADSLAVAAERDKSGKFPTGLKVTIGGKEYIARPSGATGSGGVTYSLQPGNTVAGTRPGRLNRFSFSLMGEHAVQPSAIEFDTENFDL